MNEKYRELCMNLQNMNSGAGNGSFVSSLTIKYQTSAHPTSRPLPTHQTRKSPLRSGSEVVSCDGRPLGPGRPQRTEGVLGTS